MWCGLSSIWHGWQFALWVGWWATIVCGAHWCVGNHVDLKRSCPSCCVLNFCVVFDCDALTTSLKDRIVIWVCLQFSVAILRWIPARVATEFPILSCVNCRVDVRKAFATVRAGPVTFSCWALNLVIVLCNPGLLPTLCWMFHVFCCHAGSS